MNKYRLTYYLLFTTLVISCSRNGNRLSSGDWREYLNDSTVIDYTLSPDTISIKSAGFWFTRIPFFYDKSVYYSKIDSSEIIRIIKWIDNSHVIINSGKPYNSTFIKIKYKNIQLPDTIRFDLIDLYFKHDTSQVNGLGNSDYLLSRNGDYKFYIKGKLYQGRIDESLKNQLYNYLGSIDSMDNTTTQHYFDIHMSPYNYQLVFYYEDRKVEYKISNRQPTQLSRITYNLEKIWYEILHNCGYKIE